MKKSTIALSVMALAIIGSGAYFWWLATPLRSIEEAATAIKTHDTAKFQEFVDEQSLIEGVLDDLAFRPIIETSWANASQRNAAVEAARLAKPSLEKSLQRQLDAYVAGTSVATAEQSAEAATPGVAPAMGTNAAPGSQIAQSAPLSEPNQPFSTSGRGTLRDVFREAKGHVHCEVGRLKNVALANMQNHAHHNQDQLVCQLISADKETRRSIVKERLQQYGFERANFRGIAYIREIPTVRPGTPGLCVIGINFQSPKTGGIITPEVSLVQTRPFGPWRIGKLSNLRTLVTTLEPTYDHDLQQLALATASGVTPEAVVNEVKHTASKILNGGETRTFFKNLKSRAREFGLIE